MNAPLINGITRGFTKLTNQLLDELYENLCDQVEELVDHNDLTYSDSIRTTLYAVHDNNMVKGMEYRLIMHFEDHLTENELETLELEFC